MDEELLDSLLDELPVSADDENRARNLVALLAPQGTIQAWLRRINDCLALGVLGMDPELAERSRPVLDRLKATRMYLVRRDLMLKAVPVTAYTKIAPAWYAKTRKDIVNLAKRWREVEDPPYLYGDGLLCDIVREMDMDQTLNQYRRWLESGGRKIV